MCDILHQLVYEQGFVFPIRILSFGADDSLITGRCDMDQSHRHAVFSPLAEHLFQGGLPAPVTVGFFDAG
jgi:hypothetical protein